MVSMRRGRNYKEDAAVAAAIAEVAAASKAKTEAIEAGQGPMLEKIFGWRRPLCSSRGSQV